MRRLITVPFETWHLDAIDIPEEQVVRIANGFKKEIAFMPYNYHIGTCFYDGEVLMVGGITKLWPGVGELWCFISNSFNKIPLREFIRVANSSIEDAINKYSFHRLQITIANDKKQMKFCRLFGFETEGLLRKFTSSGEDHWMASRVR